MKKYITGLLILGVLMLGSSLGVPSKVEAGALTNTQISNVLNLLQQYGVSASTQSSVQTTLSSTNATNTSATPNGCTGGYIFNIYTGANCPTTAAGTSSTTTSTTSGTVNPNAQYPYGTTGTTNTTTTTTNTTTNTSACSPANVTNVVPSITINGTTMPCVKVCTGTLAWNVLTSTVCTVISTNVTSVSNASIKVIYPNGAESFDPGETIAVKWETTGVSYTNDKVFILLNYYTPAGVFITNSKLVDTLTMNDGGEQVKLPTTLPSGASWGNNFKVVVGVESIASDESDMNFMIE